MKKIILTCLLLITSQAFSQNAKADEAVFAAGCFWCIEKDMEKIDGVSAVVSGYAGGESANPTYEKVSSGATNYIEAVKVTYDPKVISYQKLLSYFWKNIDPFDDRGQFCDKGDQYKSAIFYDNDKQKDSAIKSKSVIEKDILGKDVTTQIIPVKSFYKAEGYHQDYYKKNSVRYNFYRWKCGRDARLKEVWQGKDLSAISDLL